MVNTTIQEGEDKMKFSRETEDILLKSGWFAERNEDISDYIEYYIENNFKFNDTVLDFLKQFANIRVLQPMSTNPKVNVDFYINPTECYYNHEYDERAGEYLVPIGLASCDHMDLLMSHLGIIYTGYAEELFRYGNDYISAVENLCQYQFGTKIPYVFSEEDELYQEYYEDDKD